MADDDIRVIVCGSRDYEQPELVHEVIRLMTISCHKNGRRLVIVHGACPTGADKAAADAVQKLQREGYSVVEEPHPADWDNHGKPAGPIRNSAMAKHELGARLCIPFWQGELYSAGSGVPGTVDMFSKAKRAKIPLVFPVARADALALLRPVFDSIGMLG